MNDRELLEMAAKAAGLDVEFWPLSGANIVSGPRAGLWQPLDDDGDALRLAVTLDLMYDEALWERTRIAYCAAADQGDRQDPCAATRRAIVRAAAAVGQAMP